MTKLKVFFVMGMITSVLAICAFAPGICIDRFVLPDGCSIDCSGSTSICYSCYAGEDCNAKARIAAIREQSVTRKLVDNEEGRGLAVYMKKLSFVDLF